MASIRKAIRKAGGKPKADPETLAKALDLIRNEGLTPTEAAEQVGVGKTTIYDELRRQAQAEVEEASGEAVSEDDLVDAGAVDAADLDDLKVYDGLIVATKKRLVTCPPTRYGALVKVLSDLLRERRKLLPPKPKTDEELEADARATADDVIQQLDQAVSDREARAAREGHCAHCGTTLEAAS